MTRLPAFFDTLPPDQPVLIAGPTGSGKSALAVAVAEARGGQVINADALQVYANWHILTSRPSPADADRAPHRLYGHVAAAAPYSVGHWLREVAGLMAQGLRPIIVGGTGLYFSALTEGLAEIPETPPDVRAAAEALSPDALRAALDAPTLGRIDQSNPARLRRAWEVLQTTGRGLAAWQDTTPPPLLPLKRACAVVIDAPKEALSPRLVARFDAMLAAGALEEARANLDGWDPTRPSARAIGAPELIAHLQGWIPLSEAREAAITSTRRYAKRQRTWFRARMKAWSWLPMADLS